MKKAPNITQFGGFEGTFPAFSIDFSIDLTLLCGALLCVLAPLFGCFSWLLVHSAFDLYAVLANLACSPYSSFCVCSLLEENALYAHCPFLSLVPVADRRACSPCALSFPVRHPCLSSLIPYLLDVLSIIVLAWQGCLLSDPGDHSLGSSTPSSPSASSHGRHPPRPSSSPSAILAGRDPRRSLPSPVAILALLHPFRSPLSPVATLADRHLHWSPSSPVAAIGGRHLCHPRFLLLALHPLLFG